LPANWTLTELAGHVHLAPTYLVRLFKAATGLPPMAYLARRFKAHYGLSPTTYRKRFAENAARLNTARLGTARLGTARLGTARLGTARLGTARLNDGGPSPLLRPRPGPGRWGVKAGGEATHDPRA
jgi:hypothetical protein